MDKNVRCWIADYGEFAEEALMEIAPDGSEEIKTDGKKAKDEPVTIRAWHVSIAEAIKLKAHLQHGKMTDDFTVYVKRGNGKQPCRKLRLDEWWPDAVTRRKTSRSVTEQVQKVLERKKPNLVRGRVGTISTSAKRS